MIPVLERILLAVPVVALLIGTASLPGIAHAETLSSDTSTWPDDSPALPANDEAATEPQMPDGSFDIPEQTVVEREPSAAPISPPPIGDAVATWNYSLSTADLAKLREFRESRGRSSTSGGGNAKETTAPQATEDDSDGPAVVGLDAHERAAPHVGPVVRGGCLQAGKWRMRACVH